MVVLRHAGDDAFEEQTVKTSSSPSNTNAYSYRNCYVHAYTNSHSDINGDRNGHSYAEAAPDTAASPNSATSSDSEASHYAYAQSYSHRQSHGDTAPAFQSAATALKARRMTQTRYRV